MTEVLFYLRLFLRRLHWFLLIAVVVSAVSVIAAFSLPPAYVSQTRLIVEASQIPDELAPSTVRVSGLERLQIIEQRLMTRPNILAIANRLNVLQDQSSMTPDEIVEAMQARTRIRSQAGRDQATLMTISFEARTARLAAQVLNEYLSLIQQSDIDIRQGRAGQTLEFFEAEVQRLEQQLQEQSAKILAFKNENLSALPDSLDFRQSQRADLQERMESAGREIFTLKAQRQQLINIFNEATKVGSGPGVTLSPSQQSLADARAELESALLLYSEVNPRVKILQSRVASLEAKVAEEAETAQSGDDAAETGNPQLNLQLAEIDTRIQSLESQSEIVEARIAALSESIDQTPANTIMLAELEREAENLQGRYNLAVNRLAAASTGERIEVMSRGERISVIEQPSVPSRPTKPNRVKIAAAGSMFGLLLGFGLIALLEFMNRTPRRPEDIIRKLEVWPMAAIPYTRTRREIVLQRSLRLAAILIVVVGAPIAVWAVHEYYLPLDLLADKIMNKLGVRL
ncbi:MAG: lipopolysaccharide biosynthesis [Pseudooceanicola sp.]|jgi:polysaccharide chain length determinant protein (PEP-CTERM system associated)|nr:lipopolysaccharide biosynthesis [Pseudooceanicola sp.]